MELDPAHYLVEGSISTARAEVDLSIEPKYCIFKK